MKILRKIFIDTQPKRWMFIPFACFWMAKWIFEPELYLNRGWRLIFTEFNLMASMLISILIFGTAYKILS